MEKKILIAGGCSYTDKDFKSNATDVVLPDPMWPMWPEHLANKLGLENRNVALRGNGNLNIFESVLKAITLYGDRVEAVVVLWSGWDRSVLFNMLNVVTINAFYTHVKQSDKWNTIGWIEDTKLKDWLDVYLNTNWWDPPTFIRESTNYSLALMSALATICESKNIKYLFYQGVTPIELYGLNEIENHIKRPSGIKYNLSEFEILKWIKQSPFSGELEKRKDKILGWPFLANCGGHHLDSLRYSQCKPPFPNGPLKISEMDHHPNGEAQLIISDIFYDKWKDLYKV